MKLSIEEEKRLENLAVEKLEITISQLKSKGLKEGINLARIGYWVWVDGEVLKTDAVLRGTIKGLGYQYSGKRLAWSWSPVKRFCRGSKDTLPQLAQKYGSQGYKI